MDNEVLDMQSPDVLSSTRSEYNKKKWIKYVFMAVAACVTLVYYFLGSFGIMPTRTDENCTDPPSD